MRGTVASCCLGVFLGIVVSPVMWLTYYNPRLHSLDPLCRHEMAAAGAAGNEPLGLGAGVTPTVPLQGWAVNEEGRNGRWEGREPDFSRLLGDYRRTNFNLSVEHGPVRPPGSPKLRFKKMMNELAPRKLLFIGVVTAQKYLDTRAVAINNTWGRGLSDLYYFSAHSGNSDIQLPIITLPGVNDSVYPPQRKVYHMLKYMHDHFIEEYDFFMRSDDDVYVKTDLLHELLSRVNPAQDIYMGCPGFGKPSDRSRIQLEEEEHYCMGGPGVIFSRSALRRLAPHLDKCLKVSSILWVFIMSNSAVNKQT